MNIEQAGGARLTPAEREAAERRLQEAVGDGLLELDEFDERIDIVLRAHTRGELEPALTGLPALDARPDRTRRPRRLIAAVLGEDKVEGRWRPADETVTIAALGETTLDFRHAQLDREEVAVTAVAWLGEVNIVVPPDVEVEMSGFALLGERKDRSLPPSDDRGPLLRVRAFAVLGEVKVRTQERERPATALPAPAPARHPQRRRSGRVARWLAAGGVVLALLGAGRFVGSYDAAAVFGETTYRVPATAQEVDALSLFGSVDVIVPPDVRVEPRAFALFGSQECLACDRPAPEDGPVLVIRSFTLFGSLEVRESLDANA
ncbi:MAG: DUF1707 SHOCT-like domain-containing protein [Egibacteraceae bacterium]